MVNPIELYIKDFKDTLRAFLTFLEFSEKEINNKKALESFTMYVQDFARKVDQQLTEMTFEKSSSLLGSLSGVSRYSGEFNWFDDQSFNDKRGEFTSRLFQIALDIQEYFEQKQEPLTLNDNHAVPDFFIVDKFDSGEDYLIEFEAKHQLTLPEEFKSFLKKYGGGVPNRRNYYKELSTGGVYDFYISAFYGNSPDSRALDLGFHYIMSLGEIPRGYLPIADDGVGNKIAIGMDVDNMNKISILWHEKEANPTHLNGSLEEFISHLR